MLRNLSLMAMVCMVVCAMTSTSEARARGRSFKVTSTDGTDAGIAFGLVAAVTVHTPDGDVHGAFTETPAAAPLALIVSNVKGAGFDNGYAGSFNGTVIDLNFGLPGNRIGPVIIFGTGIGTTGPYAFYGTAKN